MSCQLKKVKRGGRRSFTCPNRTCRKPLYVDWYSSHKAGATFGTCPHCEQDITFNVILTDPAYHLTPNKFTEAKSLPRCPLKSADTTELKLEQATALLRHMVKEADDPDNSSNSDLVSAINWKGIRAFIKRK